MNERSFIYADMIAPSSLPSRGEYTRQAIIEAAYSLFIEQGFHATSMRQIAQQAGMAVGGIYNHFASKEAIFDVLIIEKHPYRQIIPILQSAPGDTLEAFARNGAQTIVAELNRRPDFLKLILIEIIEFNGRHMPILFKTIYPQVEPLLERFNVPDSRLREIPLPIIMRTFIGLFISYYLLHYVAIADQDPGLLAGSEASQLVDIFLNGILKPPGTG
jgi:AcrR family transcriptional regulator